MDDRQTYDDEIDLVDYFKVLVRRRWTIVVVTALIGFIGIGYNYGKTVTITYQAEAWVMIRPPILKDELTPSEFGMDVYQALAKAQDLADAIIDSLELVYENGARLSPSTLVASMDVEAKTGQTVLKLLVDAPDSSIIPPVQVANAWAGIFVQRNTGIYSKEIIGSYDFISEQYLSARRNLYAAEDSLDAFDQQFDMETLQTQLDANRPKLVDFQTKYVDVKLSLATQANTLQSLERRLKAVETPDGLWVGSVDDPARHADGLDASGQQVLQSLVKIRNRILEIQDKIDRYINQHDLRLLDQEIAVKQRRLNNLLVALGPLQLESVVVDQALKSVQGPMELNLPRLPEGGEIPSQMLWSLLSLQTGHNFFQSRWEHIEDTLPRLRAGIDSLEIVRRKKYVVLDRMKNSLRLQELIYVGLDDQYDLRDRLVFYGQQLEALRSTTKSLVVKISVLATKRPRLVRDVEIFKSTFNKYANLMEEANVVRGKLSGDVKVLARAVVPRVVRESHSYNSPGIFFGTGLVLSLFVAFFQEFIERARKQLSQE
jgi:uncharacterized protein involved in exopolysaccharide biosynthesis